DVLKMTGVKVDSLSKKAKSNLDISATNLFDAVDLTLKLAPVTYPAIDLASGIETVGRPDEEKKVGSTPDKPQSPKTEEKPQALATPSTTKEEPKDPVDEAKDLQKKRLDVWREQSKLPK